MADAASASMRDTHRDEGHRAKVADSSTAAKADPPAPTNFEYDDNEWDIGIGDLIIDLDADIEKTNEKVASGAGAVLHTGGTIASCGMSSAANTAASKAAGGKMAIEHSATVDKGLKMKIKRTKPGTKTSEAKHEIVKSGELNGGGEGKHPVGGVTPANNVGGQQPQPASVNSGSKRGSSGHRRDKVREKHGGEKVVVVVKPNVVAVVAPTPTPTPDVNGVVRPPAGAVVLTANNQTVATAQTTVVTSATVAVTQPSVQTRVLFPANPGPGPPAVVAPNAPGPPVNATPVVPVVPIVPVVVVPVVSSPVVIVKQEPPQAVDSPTPVPAEDIRPESPRSPVSPSPRKKAKPSTDPKVPAATLRAFHEVFGEAVECRVKAHNEGSSRPGLEDRLSRAVDLSIPKREDSCARPSEMEKKDVTDVCVGTSVGTITEPDCLGPCEPGTSVTLEGIVWHETEGGVLVVNVTWRGKTYVGTLLDCTRHDWAPPRFCDSPTSDLDSRIPKGRGKRGRAAAAAAAAATTSTTSDLSNFTETRSSVHSKLRNGGAKGRRGGGNGSTNGNGGPPASTGTNSPTPFLPPRLEGNGKRKNRTPEEETTVPLVKKSKVAATSTASGSPPVSPVLLECPEPNCSKKYKHINGLKYHQSHAHGSADDEDTKESTSENEESNPEAVSPAPLVKSPEKTEKVERKEEMTVNVPPSAATTPSLSSTVAESPCLPAPKSGVLSPSPLQQPPVLAPQVPTPAPAPAPAPALVPVPPALPELAANPSPVQTTSFPSPDIKSIIKPGVLTFGQPVEEFPVGLYCGNKPVQSPMSASIVRGVNVTIPANQPPVQSQPQSLLQPLQPLPLIQTPSILNQQQHHHHSQQQQQQQPPPLQPQQQQQPPPQQPQPQLQQPPIMQTQPIIKPTQFKVKPTAALMPEEKKERIKLPGHKKKMRKSPAGSPHPPDQPPFGLDQSGREDVQSPAYSDISDDAAPVLESEGGDGKGKGLEGVDKKIDVTQGPSPHAMPHYNMYPFYGQPPYLVPSVQQEGKPKDSVNKLIDSKLGEKDKKEGSNGGEYQQKLLPQHYYPFGYVPGYPGYLEPSYPIVMSAEEKGKEILKEDNSPSPADHGKVIVPSPSPIQVPNLSKIKGEPGIGLKEKHQNDNHQIIKESIEMKNQMASPYLYSRQHQQQQHQHQQAQQQQQQQQQQHQQQQEDLRRYYLYPEQQRRKEPQNPPELPPKVPVALPKPTTLPSPSHKHKEKCLEEKKEEKVKQEGVKPTMETQGPPPPPTSSYAYIHPSYMQSPHYGALPFDPGHPMYRGMNPMLVPGPYGGNPYLHHQMPRYHAPEDLSRPPTGPTKALDLLQHHASQYYSSSHKIHELQERALKSPTPKSGSSNPSPSGVAPPSGPPSGPGPQGPPASSPGGPPLPGKPSSTPDGKDSRSPPPQRHVHTHHHTHVGLGYPILASQYPAPYGATVLASHTPQS